jgi:hypothetical protein
MIDFVVVKLLQGEVSSELGNRAAHNSNFDWIDELVGTEENLLDLEVLGSILFCTVTVRIMLPANVQGHVVLDIVKLDLALATVPIAHWASAPLHRGLATIDFP